MPALTIEEIFKAAIKLRASDVHLVVGLPPVLRIDGVLRKMEEYKELTAKEVQILVFSLLTEKQREEYVNDRELDLSYELPNLSRFRVNLHWERNYPGMVARLISPKIPSMEDVGMPKIIYDLCKQQQGLVLVTGPTGCGKSTSLAAMIDYINKERAAHIITLEDPIEFLYEPKKSIVKQRQLGTDMLSFAQGLKHVLRQDPNVILVGEMRDLETIASTITLAETGHLVLATLHTFNAPQTIDRIIDVFPPYQQSQVRLQLSLFLKGIVSQMLLPRAGGGRIASREVLINTPAVGNLIRENKIAQIKTAIQTGVEDGMVTMDQDIKKLFDEGLVTEQIAVTHMANPQALH